MKILGLLDNTLTANCECSRGNRENFQLPDEMKLSGKPSIFCNIFLPYSESKLNLQSSQTKKKSHKSSPSEVIDSKKCAYLIA